MLLFSKQSVVECQALRADTGFGVGGLDAFLPVLARKIKSLQATTVPVCTCAATRFTQM